MGANGTDGREYPWGNEFDVARCNTVESEIGGTSPVDRFPTGASPYGTLDMAGNVWEWTASDWDKSHKVLRGGSWCYDQDFARCAYRLRNAPVRWYNHVGFRVASPGS
ncbi:MAG: SUMF1/EgtB/PvdO family nonheme iron enzyme [Anaerolineae bacterium]